MSEDFTLYRGESGKPQVVDFRCPHRQSTLSIGWVEGDCIRCRFHGWKFDGAGQCVEQPAEKEAFAEKVRIRSCPTQEYLGLIFVYFGEGEAPPLPRYRDFEKDGLWVETYVRPCNFLNNIENDPVHIPFTHKESEFFLRRPREIPAVVQEETEWGLMLTTSTATGRVQYLHYGMPNILAFKESDRDHLAWRVPLDDESHASFQLDIQHVRDGIEGEAVKKRHAARTGKLGRSPNELGAAVLRGKIRIQDLEGDDRANIVWVQDYAVQVGQGPIELRKKENLGRSDTALILQRKIWGARAPGAGRRRPAHGLATFRAAGSADFLFSSAGRGGTGIERSHKPACSRVHSTDGGIEDFSALAQPAFRSCDRHESRGATFPHLAPSVFD